MSLSHEHVGSKIPAKIITYILTRAELLIHICHETPCNYDTCLLMLDGLLRFKFEDIENFTEIRKPYTVRASL